MDIYTCPRSRSLRVTWAAEELGLTYRCLFVNPQTQSASLPGKNHKIPAIVDNDTVIFESSAICIYLAQRYGNGQLYPSAVQEQAVVHQWLAYIISELEAPLWLMLKHTMLLPEAQREPAVLKPATADARRALDLLEQEISGKAWLCNSAFSVADIFLFHTARWAATLGFSLSDELNRWLTKLEQRPALHRARAREQAAAEGKSD